MRLPATFRGHVVPGRGVGATLGVPTANLDAAAVPPAAWGVYHCWVFLPSGPWQPGVAHLGPATTFGHAEPKFEVHLLDWTGDLGGSELVVQLVSRVRGTERFADAAALSVRVQQDIVQAREYFRDAQPPGHAAAFAPRRLEENRRIWQRKAVLRRVYQGWYRRVVAQLKPGVTLEVGCGTGNFKQFKPDVVATDVQPLPWVDVVADAEALPFPAAAFANIVAIDTLHHLRRPVRLLREAQRVLCPGGRLVLLEPYVSPWSYLVYRFGDHEPLDRSARLPITPAEEAATPDTPGEYANEALPTLLFSRDRAAVAQQVPQLAEVHREYLACLLYPLSGGFSRPSLIPPLLFRPLERLDHALVRWLGHRCALRVLLVLEKRAPPGARPADPRRWGSL